MIRILIVDDDKALCSLLSQIITGMGHECTQAHTIAEGKAAAAAGLYDIIFLDVSLPDGSGLDLLPALRRSPLPPEVIIITSAGDPDGAVLAIKNGAWDYLEKPFRKEQITLHISRATEYRRALQSRQRSVAFNRDRIIGSSALINECLDVLVQAASGDASVLITGETGTGKELFAQAIHENNSRRNGSFVVVDCAALPETLVESVLFGYMKGAFTGADRDREGLIRQADGGTLFLDEIGELPLNFQKVLLRVLQEHRFRPLGAKHEEESDFRVVCATNRDLAGMVKKGDFRGDLLYRIRSVTIHIPPLRDRTEDIRELVKHYVAKYCERTRLGIKGIAPEFFEALIAYPWPGNVRELLNAIEHAVSIARDDMMLVPKQLPEHIRIHAVRASVGSKAREQAPQHKTARDFEKFPQLQQFRDSALADIERQYLCDLVSQAQGDIEKACRLSGLARARIYGLLKKYGLSLRL